MTDPSDIWRETLEFHGPNGTLKCGVYHFQETDDADVLKQKIEEGLFVCFNSPFDKDYEKLKTETKEKFTKSVLPELLKVTSW